MSTWSFVLLAALSGQTPEAGADATGQVAEATAEPAAPRPYHEISRDLGEALRAEALARTPAARSEAVGRIVELYAELKHDPRLDNSDTLKRYKAKLWSRMTRIKRDLERDLARRGDGSAGTAGEQDVEQILAATGAAADQMATLHYAVGGPALLFQQSGGSLGGGAVNDYSQQLIDLIERTIRPDFWDTNGGPGSMVYYRPLMALVVSATSEVHGNVGGLLRALREAGN